MSMKNPVTPAGIEPATFRFIVQNLNDYANAVRFCVKCVGNFKRLTTY